ncbi:hypothetical protein TWF225_009821 [Orbilia oligospora]|nr:hypothetical protein TWF225_009821 [Orbilia oligospora]KAF3245200.1 hypothetical protein TWF217_010536 [Orbilia oligospora]KAF3255588.1 hypothetical protein TWF128_005582 [Orbilia oligospora]
MRLLLSSLLVQAGYVACHSIQRRQEVSSTDVCLRWAHQATIVDSTLYIYGGRSRKSSQQTENTWNNDFLSLSLSKDFNIASTPLTGLPKPNGPPAVALGYLWHDYSSLYLYGGQYSDTPPVEPDPFELWKYSIKESKWSTDASTTNTQPKIERAAEGAGVTIPNRDNPRGYYFGGHLDGYTTNGWSQSTPRLYLTSMIEYDMSSSTWTNHTEEGASFPERADGVVVYIPWGGDGILLALGGGDNVTFSQLNVIDVFDIKKSKWTKQATTGPTPQIRVNACAVVFSAPDNSSHNIYMYGGQNLQPAGEQTQYDDIWILTIPLFKWIKVETDGQSNPPARAGHTCHAYRGQMLVVGGFVGSQLSCDTGIYVFDASTLQWQTTFHGGPNTSGDSTNTYDPSSSSSKQLYVVPDIIVSQIGGSSTGGATVTAPEKTAVPDSPLTGSNPEYTYKPDNTPITTAIPVTSTITADNGEVITTVITSVTTTTPTGNPNPTGSSGNNNNDNKSTPVGIIVGSTVGSVALVISVLLLSLFLWYKRRVRDLQRSYEEDRVSQGLVGNRPVSMVSSNIGGGGAGGRHHNYSAVMDGRSKEDLMEGVEPTFWGMLLQPRRSLRVVNH